MYQEGGVEALLPIPLKTVVYEKKKKKDCGLWISSIYILYDKRVIVNIVLSYLL